MSDKEDENSLPGLLKKELIKDNTLYNSTNDQKRKSKTLSYF